MTRYIKVYKLGEYDRSKYGKYLLECGVLTTNWDEIHFSVTQTQTGDELNDLKETADVWMQQSYLDDQERAEFIDRRFKEMEND